MLREYVDDVATTGNIGDARLETGPDEPATNEEPVNPATGGEAAEVNVNAVRGGNIGTQGGGGGTQRGGGGIQGGGGRGGGAGGSGGG